MVEKRDFLYEGKAKKIYTTDDPDLLWVEFKDDATAFNGQKKGTIVGKGSMNAKISAAFFKRLAEAGIENHFVDLPQDRVMIVKRLQIIPVEVIVRNKAAGSLSQRLGIPEGKELACTVLEFSYKNDELGDPMINDYHALAMELATAEELEYMKKTALAVNDELRSIMAGLGVDLIDFKLEFGRHKGKILLGDEITPDTCRFWDLKTGEKLDKDRFRRDLGGVEEAYSEILRRVTGGN